MVVGNFYSKNVKPFIDRLSALMLIFFLSPLLIFLSIILFILFKGKLFFTQLRVGQNDKPFWILKFRSMRDALREDESDSERLNFIGKFIRRTSLDELPQLINVLRGEMSMIGPRPLLPEYLLYYNERERKRHLVRPGITGLSQVKARNEPNWERRLEYDFEYVSNISFWLDLRILLLTFPELVKLRRKKSTDKPMRTFTEFASKR